MNHPRIIFLLLLFFAVHAAGQPLIRASVDKNKILLGEHFQLTVEAKYPLQLKGILNIDSIGHFERTDAPSIDSSTENGVVTIRKIFRLTSFDSGHWVIPAFAINKKLHSDTIPMDVVFSDFDTSQAYHPIKEIIPVTVKKEISWWWYAAGPIILLLAVTAWLLTRKKKKKPVPVIVSKLDPYQEALKELESLAKNKPDPKTYYTRLTDILRLYLYRKKGMLSLQKTTDDLVIQMKDLPLTKEEFDKAGQILRLADFVKFARYQPSADDDGISLQVIKNTIMAVENSTTDKVS